MVRGVLTALVQALSAESLLFYVRQSVRCYGGSSSPSAAIHSSGRNTGFLSSPAEGR